MRFRLKIIIFAVGKCNKTMNMKSKKVMKKTYVLMLSQSFPTKHPRSGKPTGFRE